MNLLFPSLLIFIKKEENKLIAFVLAISFRQVYNYTTLSFVLFGKWKALSENDFVRALSLAHKGRSVGVKGI